MSQAKRKLRRHSSVFGRSKDDTFKATSKGRRKGQILQNRWVKFPCVLRTTLDT